MAKIEMIESFLNNIFGSRAKILADKIVPVWIREIAAKAPDVFVLQAVEKAFCQDDTIALTIPQICRMIDEAKINLQKKHMLPSGNKSCPYCGGRGLATCNVHFDTFGNIVAEDVALTCCCDSGNKNKLLQMKLNEADHNRTEYKYGYFLVFRSLAEKEEYKRKMAFVKKSA